MPIVVLAAAEDARKRAEEIGAVGWIGKPFDLDALVDTVKRSVGERKGKKAKWEAPLL